jgi:hypothetical protein
LIEGLGKFKDTTGRLPVLIVATPHREDAPVIADDDTGNADRVQGRV